MYRMNDSTSALDIGCLKLLDEENEKIRREREEEERLRAESVKATVESVPKAKGDSITPEMRGFCRWVIEQYYLAMEDPEWVAAIEKYKEVCATEGEVAAEKYLPPFKVRHKEKRVPAGTGTLSCKSAEKSKVKNSAKKIITQSI